MLKYLWKMLFYIIKIRLKKYLAFGILMRVWWKNLSKSCFYQIILKYLLYFFLFIKLFIQNKVLSTNYVFFFLYKYNWILLCSKELILFYIFLNYNKIRNGKNRSGGITLCDFTPTSPIRLSGASPYRSSCLCTKPSME